MPDFETWLQARGWKLAELHPNEVKLLRACYDAEAKQGKPIQAAAPQRGANQFDLRGKATLSIQAAEGDKPAERRFEIVLYTGEPLIQGWWDAPVVVDLEGVDLGSGVFPILDAHGQENYAKPMRECVVGQSESAVIEDGKLILRGKMIEVNEACKNIIALADAGFNWQSSIGAQTGKKDFIAEGNTVQCNGRTYEGPVYVARQTQLKEGSFVVIGADKNATAVIATGTGATPMTFADFCKTKGHDDVTKMTAAQKAEMEAAYAAADGVAAAEDPEPDDDEGEGDDKPKKKVDAKTAPLDIRGGDTRKGVEEYRKAQAREEKRIRGIRDLTASNAALTTEITDDKGQTQKVNIREHAIAAGWSKQKTELAVIRAERAGGGNVEVPNTWYSPSAPQMSEAVIEAAVLQAGQCRLFDDEFFKANNDRGAIPFGIRKPLQRELAARYTDQVQQAAHDMFKGRIGLWQVLAAGAQMNGKRIKETIRDDLEIEAALRANNWIRGEGFSTASLSNVLANVLNKFIFQAYLFGEMSWREICAVRPMKDFKPSKGVALFAGDGAEFQRVGADGNLKHADLQDQAFANQIFTEGRMFAINRQTIINDDLSVLTTVPMIIGRGSILKINKLFWTAFMSTTGYDDGGTTAFWSATHTKANGVSMGNSNLSSGAGSALGVAGLQAAQLLFDKQIGPDLQPLGIDPEILLFPPDLETTAWELTHSETLVYGGASASKQPSKNRFVNRFKPVKSRYLSNTAYTGYSTTAHYLLADPGVCPVIEVAFLNGQETPTVQTAQANFSVLGIEIRGFFDVGVNMQNFRGGVKSAGA